jgi:hypothetical protein
MRVRIVNEIGLLLRVTMMRRRGLKLISVALGIQDYAD